MAETKVEDGPEPVTAAVARPDGWMYRGFRLGGRTVWYASPAAQLGVVAAVCFLCPGMFNALGGLGGAGLADATVADHANVALYSTFAVVGFMSGTLANRLGVRHTLALGGLGYCLYAAGILVWKRTGNGGFPIFAGALLGLCAALLWTGQGAIMMSYPPEQAKGRYISWFWVIFNLGAVIGALIPLAQNVNNSGTEASDGTFAAFIVLMFLGAVVALAVCDADKVRRHDGSGVIMMKNPSWWSELRGLWETLYLQPWIVLLFPMFFASNLFYTYQQNGVNGAAFNIRARSLNNLLYWLAQIMGALTFGYALDLPVVRRSLRAKISFVALLLLTMAVWGGGYAWQRKQVPRAVADSDAFAARKLDWTAGTDLFVGPMFLYMAYGFYDAAWQTCIYWYMGALSNSSRRSANLAGFYKGIQSAGAAIFWRLDAVKTEFDTMFAATWALCAVSLIIAAPVLLLKIKDTVPLEEDLKFSDETVDDVAPSAASRTAAADAGVQVL